MTEDRTDFLTGPAAERAQENSMGFRTLTALTDILREIRRNNVTQRCVVDVASGTAILNSAADTAIVRFLSSGKPVLAQYLVVSNNTAQKVNVGLNEPVSVNPALTYGTGIELAAGETIHIPVSIESIQIRLITVGAALGISVNNDPAGIGANGVVQVYAWTHTNSDKDES